LKRVVLALSLVTTVAFAQDAALKPAESLPAFAADDLDLDTLKKAIAESRRVLSPSADKPRTLGGVAVTKQQLLGTLDELERIIALPRDRWAAEISSSLVVYRSVGSDGKGTVLFTGYHSPCYEGSLVRTERCRWPLRRPPGSSVTYTRKEIEGEGKLDDQKLEVAWFANRLDAFLMEVQGSGSIRCPDGKVVRLQCKGTNGRAYVSLGKELVKDGKVEKEKISIPAIREYFTAHPEELEEYLWRNPSYVFFVESSVPPTGCTGAYVTGGRSIATDKKIFCGSAVAFIVVEIPVVENGKVVRFEKRSRFVMDDDTGGAIKGPGRADVYMGDDEAADAMAGVMKREGELYYLVRRSE
jgi:membrane-bound lytic murein transglycosylase A